MFQQIVQTFPNSLKRPFFPQLNLFSYSKSIKFEDIKIYFNTQTIFIGLIICMCLKFIGFKVNLVDLWFNLLFFVSIKFPISILLWGTSEDQNKAKKNF